MACRLLVFTTLVMKLLICEAIDLQSYLRAVGGDFYNRISLYAAELSILIWDPVFLLNKSAQIIASL